MTDTLTTPAFTEDANALAELSNGSSTTVATDPAQAPEPAPRPVTQRERIPTIDVVRGPMEWSGDRSPTGNANPCAAVH